MAGGKHLFQWEAYTGYLYPTKTDRSRTQFCFGYFSCTSCSVCIQFTDLLFVLQVHLLCLLSHGMLMNRTICNNPELQAFALSCVPTDLISRPPDSHNIHCLIKLVKWFKDWLPVDAQLEETRSNPVSSQDTRSCFLGMSLLYNLKGFCLNWCLDVFFYLRKNPTSQNLNSPTRIKLLSHTLGTNTNSEATKRKSCISHRANICKWKFIIIVREKSLLCSTGTPSGMICNIIWIRTITGHFITMLFMCI